MEFSKIAMKDLSLGIDARSAENAIQPGYAEDLLNCETNSQGYIAKRRGYQGYYGYVPLRVKEVHQSGTALSLCFDQSISLLTKASSPLVVYGNLGKPDGTVTGSEWDNTDVDGYFAPEARYYTGFSVAARSRMAPTSSGTFDVDNQSEVVTVLTGVSQAPSVSTLDNAIFIPDGIRVNKSSPYEISYDYTNNSSSEVDVFTFQQDGSTAAGQRYADTFVSGDFSGNVLTIAAATHQLTNINIIPQIYEDTGSEYELIIPDRFVVKANGNVEITVSSAFDGMVILQDIPPNQVAEVGVSAHVLASISTTPVSGQVFFHAVYLRDLGTGDREMVIPDSVVYTESTNTLLVTALPTQSGVLEVLYQPAAIIANCLVVTDSTGTNVTYDDHEPQLTVWGIAHEGLYVGDSEFGGHVTHIDSYRRELESRAVVGLGGTFYAARTRTEVGTDYLIPTSYLVLQARTDATKTIGPAFHQTGDSTSITRAIFADNIEDHLAVVTEAEYTGTSGQVHFYLDLQNKSGTLNDLTVDDQLTITQMAFRKLNGTHPIIAINNAMDRITVSIPDITTADFNEVGAQGRAGVFTDSLELQVTSPFIVDDYIRANVFEGFGTPQVYDVDTSTVFLNGLTEEVTVQGGLLLRGKRSSNLAPVLSVSNYVVGDMCAIDDLSREIRIVSIDTATNTLELDETLELEDLEGNEFGISVVGRWIPIETPVTVEDLPRRTYPQLLTSTDYDNQPILRSTMLSSNLYVLNGSDEVYKFDGTSIYRAGLQRWQPQLFISLDTSVGSILMPDSITGTTTWATDRFTVETTAGLTVGQQVVHTFDNTVYTIAEIISATVARATTSISGTPGTGTLRPLRKLQYYYRQNAIDANGNIVASAITGSEDYIVNLVADAQIHHKIVGMPTWDAYDFDRIETQIYRADFGSALFSLVGSVDISFDKFSGYVLYTDKFDEPVTADAVNAVVNPPVGTTQELGTSWEQPLRAKYITSIDNSLVLANVKDYAEISVTMQKATGEDITAANLSNKLWVLRKDSTDTSSTTNMVDRAVFEFVDPVTDTAQILTVNSTAWAANVLTVTLSAPATFAARSWVYLYHSATGSNKSLRGSGWYQVAAATTASATVTFNVTSSYPALGSLSDVNRLAISTAGTDIPVVIGIDGNYQTTAGNSSLSQERLAMTRLANAINATMRMTDVSLTGQDTFEPWIVASAGSEIGLGTLILRTPRADLGPALKLPTTITNASLVANQQVRTSEEVVTATERLFGSRVLVSYSNFGEIFDRPYGLDDQSSRVFDIDPADGQVLTAVIPFFAVSSFSAAQQESVLVAFKQNSIHVVGLRSGITQKLETQGIGCTVPYSVAYSRQGIIFASQSGIYRLNRDLTISYVGKYLERRWQDKVAPYDLSRATGTHYALGRQYKLSVPYGEAGNNAGVLTYDHSRETDQKVEYGAWSRYDNHPATGWANLDADSLFGTTNGQVFRLRNTGESFDYRDDASSINQEVVMAATDFGLPGSVKLVREMVVQYRLRYSDVTGTTVSMSNDLTDIYRSLDTFRIVRETNNTGLNSSFTPKVKTVSYTTPRSRGEYFQPMWVNDTIDEDMQIVGVQFTVAASSSATITQAAELR